MSPWAVPIFLACLPLLELLDAFIAKYSVDAEPWTPLEDRRTVQWGLLHSHSDDRRKPPISYFVIRLRWSLDWRRTDYGRHWCWHRRELVWTSDKGWFLWYEPLREDEPWPTE